MRIGIDARTINVMGGSRTYLVNLLQQLRKIDKVNEYYLFGVSNFLDYNCIPSNIRPNSLFRLFYDYFILPKQLKRLKIDLFHGVKGALPNVPTNIKKVVTIHDAIPFIFPQQFKLITLIFWKLSLRLSMSKANKIISVSSATKKDIIRIFHPQKNKVKVILEGFEKENFKTRDKKECYKKVTTFLNGEKAILIKKIENKKIILNVNSLNLRKNIPLLLKAFDVHANNNKDSILIIIGKETPYTKNILQIYKQCKNKSRIYFLNFVPDEMVSYFYNIATVFVYPSFYEGFGLPILEAQACGCPVITSNTSSMPEVAGKSAILINPNSIRSVMGAINKIINNKKAQKDLISSGLDNIKRFSWANCAKETIEVYNEVCNEK